MIRLPDRAGIALLVLGAAIIVIVSVVTSRPMFVVGGSDSFSTVLAPAVPVALVIASALVLLVLAARRHGRAQLCLGIGALAVLALGTHRIVVTPDTEVRDQWLGLVISRVAVRTETPVRYHYWPNKRFPLLVRVRTGGQEIVTVAAFKPNMSAAEAD